jgi:hypothetical protein
VCFVRGSPSRVSEVLMQIHPSILDYSIPGSQCLGLPLVDSMSILLVTFVSEYCVEMCDKFKGS